MSDEEINENRQHSFLVQLVVWGSVALGIAGFLVGFVFLPLMLSFVEHSYFNTHHVEDWFRSAGLHDELARLYEPIISWARRVL